MVTTLSESYYNTMDPKPELLPLTDFKIQLTGANGTAIIYTGYIEVAVRLPCSSMQSQMLVLIVKDTGFNSKVPAIVGTNLLREYRQEFEMQSEEFPKSWEIAFDA
ncbi:hypothetical protein DPMN_190342 [Dreissena polymorpha]|uniref:Uncharacterized protein n=1 Tax=Dreissena polymorpha TaxID=45954 RepID=A0A9D4DX33_DREPO|nr:hypothetical protein DPMN_190342 [Dreissena polymorpha]